MGPVLLVVGCIIFFAIIYWFIFYGDAETREKTKQFNRGYKEFKYNVKEIEKENRQKIKEQNKKMMEIREAYEDMKELNIPKSEKMRIIQEMQEGVKDFKKQDEL